MVRWLHRFLITLAVVLFGSAAMALPVEKNPSIGEPPGATAAAAPIAPVDMPVILPTAQVALPPLPGGYVVKDLGWLELAYPEEAAERVAGIVAAADREKAALVAAFGQPVLERVQVRVAKTFADMTRLAPAEVPPPDYASGVAYKGMHLVLLSMMQPRGAEAVDLDEVFRHELAHVALEDAVHGQHVPVWFNEGLAIALSHEATWDRRGVLWNATLSDRLLPLADLDRGMPRNPAEVNIAYAEAADFMQFLSRRSDQVRFAAMIGRVRDGQPFERAVAEAYGADLHRLELEWHHELEHRFSVIPILTGGGLVWVLVIAALGVAYVRRRRRARAILERWGREEAAEDALRARLAAEAAADDAPAHPAFRRVVVRVEDGGRWHTLH